MLSSGHVSAQSVSNHVIIINWQSERSHSQVLKIEIHDNYVCLVYVQIILSTMQLKSSPWQ